jgi:restriction endonuclease Mrr
MITALVGILIAAAAYTPFSFLPSDPTLALAIALIVGELRTATAESQQQAAEEAALGNKLAAAQARYAELKGVIESRLHWLRTCQWQGMGGTAFETFLREVFQERGYEVETTAKTGDQGVDLILKRGGSRVAVQAKGYVGHSVGNGAIQQVHAGRVFHKCQTAAVVTNSTFTRPARDLAEQLDCKLVDGSQIVDLIEGRILL